MRICVIIFTCLFLSNAYSQEVTYYLPFEYLTSRMVYQGNNQDPTHNDKWNCYAFDFSPMAIGTPVCAMASGTVVFVKEDTIQEASGLISDNNEIAILHEDGNVSTYLHLAHNGALVEKGQQVLAGDVIGYSGNSGASRVPHLHVGLRQSHQRYGESQPLKFADVLGDGVPETKEWAMSLNFPIRKLVGELLALREMYDFCHALRCLEPMGPALKEITKKRIPKSIERMIKSAPQRKDLARIYHKERQGLADTYISDSKIAYERLLTAIKINNFDSAVKYAILGDKDFNGLSISKDFTKHLLLLKKGENYHKALNKIKDQLRFRRSFNRAVKADLKLMLRSKEPSSKEKIAVRKLYKLCLPFCLLKSDAALIQKKIQTPL